MKNSKIFTWLLACALVGVWGTIAYQVLDAIATDEMSAMEPQGAETEGLEKETPPYVYRDDVRDPFDHRRSAHAQPTGIDSKLGEQPPVPPYRLTGIMVRHRKKITVLESHDGSVFFLGEGDTLAGLKVLNIGDEVVSYSYKNKRQSWQLSSSSNPSVR